MLGLYSKTSHVSILTQKEWEQIEACMASLSGRGEVSFSCFFPCLCRSDGEGLQQLWQNLSESHRPLSYPFNLDFFCSFSTLQRHQMHKVMYMKEPAPEAPHLRTFRVCSCPVDWKTTNNWRIDGLWIAPFGEKKQVPLNIGKPKQSNAQFWLRTFSTNRFFNGMFFHRFYPSPKRSRGTAGNFGRSSPCLRQVTSKEAKVERRRARDDPLWKAPQPSQSEKLQQEGPEFQVRKKMGPKRLCIIKPEGFDWLNFGLFWLPMSLE